MARLRYLFPLVLLPLLSGCYADQQKQLASCEAAAPRPLAGKILANGQPFKSISACMDKAGYTFIGWNDGIVCDMPAVVAGRPSATQTGAMCFQPKGWLALKLYRMEVPLKVENASDS